MRLEPSIRTRLLVLLLAAIAALWGLTAARSYHDALHEMDELFDAQLAQSARLLLDQASHALGNQARASQAPLPMLYHPYEQKVYVQVWSAEGTLLFRSSALTPTTPLSERASGFDQRELEGQRWRVFALWDADHRLQLQLGQKYEVREELAGRIARHILFPMVFALPLLGLLVWLSVGYGIAPLRWVALEVSKRAPGHLEAIEVRGTPKEIRPVVEALNALLEQLRLALLREKQFTADAAHELRTSLGGLRTQAQVAERARDDEARQHALRHVVEGVDRMTHLVQQLLTLARLDPHDRLEPKAPVALRTLVEDVLAELAPRAIEKALELSLEEGDAITVAGHRDLLRVLIRNLVDNAVRYTPAGGEVRVLVLAEGASARVQVQDSGPGIADADRERVFDRFYRVLGSGVSGSGLGLAIVRRIGELHGAQVHLEEGPAGQGLTVSVDLPKASV